MEAGAGDRRPGAVNSEIQRDIETAARILRGAGATEVYVFGSAATDRADEHSDIDLAIRGLPPESFFPAMSQVTLAIARQIDLIDLDDDGDFARFLIERGELRRVG